jgi:predicted nucleic acid-binding protein
VTGGPLFLLDKSALARAERQDEARRALFALDSEGDLATCDIVDLEVGYSARNHTEYERIWAARSALYRTLPVTPEVTRRARQVQRLLSRDSHLRAAGVADLLIAACAEVHGAVVVHYDTDYDIISARTGQPTRWLVPRGTVG